MSDALASLLDNPKPAMAPEANIPVVWRRVGLMELNGNWPWLSERLLTRWPGQTEREIRGYLLSCLDNNEAFFICNEMAIGLFVVTRRPLEAPYVQEVFCVAQTPEGSDTPDGDYAEKLYRPAADWIRRIGIRDFHYAVFSDAAEFVAAVREADCLSRETRKLKVMRLLEAGGRA